MTCSCYYNSMIILWTNFILIVAKLKENPTSEMLAMPGWELIYCFYTFFVVKKNKTLQ